ncbi:helix-turn-helix domain-containing protein [Pengzhenrongella sicca]|uniref:MerR family DNA-binding transcriptional regulator n=1 Tax=Pengzhenrongella sicca TaxID=2819238 RepID=A0A8A4ZKM6_9MICO|nr:MerR family transcriptional regulator [Pengzhenrongella sicca]QTE31056.1 MerR family DNA-binding transcriptional regulator [Pengzhenrongella sicca]
MAWSTKQLAKLAGTTVKAIRHYHEIELLDEPHRASNGYKQYEVRHLVSLLRITRLTDLGMPLAQIAAMGRVDVDPDVALRELDEELKVTIARLSRVRAELSLLLGQRSSTDMPAGLGPLVADLSETDRSMLLVYSRVFGLAELRDLRQNMVDMRTNSAAGEFDALPPDADEATRQTLAEQYAPQLSALISRYPWMSDRGSRTLHGAAFTERTIRQALGDLYNPAQLDVYGRIRRML